MSGDEIAKDQMEGLKLMEGLKVSASIGRRLQLVRQQHGLSQRELARRAELTNSTLSMIEQGKVSPSIASLEKILSAIPMSVQAFFAAPDGDYPVITKPSDFISIQKNGLDCKIMPFASGSEGRAYLSRQIIKPESKIKSEWMVRIGFVGGILLNGELRLILDGKEYPVQPGEGFQFSLHRSHTFINPSATEEALIVAVSFAQ